MWPAGQSSPLSAKCCLREYDSCSLGVQGRFKMGAGPLVEHMILTLSLVILHGESQAQGLVEKRKTLPKYAANSNPQEVRARATAAA